MYSNHGNKIDVEAFCPVKSKATGFSEEILESPFAVEVMRRFESTFSRQDMCPILLAHFLNFYMFSGFFLFKKSGKLPIAGAPEFSKP